LPGENRRQAVGFRGRSSSQNATQWSGFDIRYPIAARS
jgi:hypothetical protein